MTLRENFQSPWKTKAKHYKNRNSGEMMSSNEELKREKLVDLDQTRPSRVEISKDSSGEDLKISIRRKVRSTDED